MELPLKLFEKEFSKWSIEHYSFNYGGEIQVFILEPLNEEVLEIQWDEVSNWIAFNFQTNLIDEYSQWNIYLFYHCDFIVGKDIIYEIENDTFSSRKIILEEKKSIDSIISKYIKHSELRLINGEKNNSNLIEKDPLLMKIFADKELRKKKNLAIAKDVYVVFKEKLSSL